MKKALRVILPILLVLAILTSAVWYLLFYDPDFTRDAILATARQFDSTNYHKLAAWLYDLAYRQSDGGDEVAIELANHYKSIGNYTKAEYTLSGAISDGGSVELYIALCQTYLEQDKILDAVNMLGNIKDPEIKAQVDALRPAIPTFDPEPGFYSQYITVNVSSDEEHLYINANGEYPSTADSGTRSVTLPEGETTIYAVAVGDNSLVSEVAIQGYTVGGVIKPVSFTDAKLDAYIREVLGFSKSHTIHTNDLWDIVELNIPEGVTAFDELQHFTYLEKLTITECGEADLSFLSNLTKLKELSITGAELSQESLRAIGTLRSLEKLTLSACGMTTVSSLEALTNLTYLDLNENTLRNIGVFAGFTKLQELHMRSNALTDISALSGLKDLKVVDVSYNSLQSISPLFGITGLQTINADSNALTSLEGIGALTALEILTLDQNLLSDVSGLSTCTALKELTISNNSVESIEFIGQLTKLMRIDFSHNKVEAFPQFAPGHALASIYASYNDITDLTPLEALSALYIIDLDYNKDLNTIHSLTKCRTIMVINCYGTKINRNPFTEDQGVVVNFDATGGN